VLLGNHIAEVDADAKFDPLLCQSIRVSLGHAALDLRSAPDGIKHAYELGKEAVARVLDDAAIVLGDLGVYQIAQVPFEPFVRSSSSAPIKREYPATSAARIAVRRRTVGMCRPARSWA
jgi:hypothetical protein